MWHVLAVAGGTPNKENISHLHGHSGADIALNRDWQQGGLIYNVVCVGVLRVRHVASGAFLAPQLFLCFVENSLSFL